MSVKYITKLLPPNNHPGLIERIRLHDKVTTLENKKATILIAPAGYGKTVFMTQLARKIAKPVVWYQLEPEDNDPAVFAEYFQAALRQAIPAFKPETFTFTKAGGDLIPKIRYLTAMLINNLTLNAPNGITIVFDDYHLVPNTVINQFIQEFLTHLPSNIHVFIASRTPLPFSLTKMFIAEEVTILGVEELRFNRKEIETYVRQFCKTATGEPDHIEHLQKITEGWPVALRLAMETLSPLPLPTRENKVLFDYLATEVLAQLPDKTRDFLMITSVLDVLSPELCDLLTNRTDAKSILPDLMKKQLFITQLSAEKHIYRYHQLFREFLQSQLGDDYQHFAHKAGVLLKNQGDWEQAFRYFNAAGAERDMVEAVVKAGRNALNNGRWSTVLSWLNALPFAFLENNPWLLLYRAEIEIFRGCIDLAEKWARKAAKLFMDLGDNAGLTETKILQARVFRCRGMYFQSLEILAEIETLLPATDYDQRLDVLMERVVSLYLTGSFTEAEDILTTALDKANSNKNRYLLPYILESLGNIYYLRGDNLKALYYFKKGMESSPEGFLPGYHTQDHMSLIYSDLGELQQAVELAKRNVARKEKLGLVDTLPSAYTHLAAIQTDLGLYEEAEAGFQKAITLLKEVNGELTYLALSLAFYGRCLWLQGRLVEAKANIEESLAIVEIKDSLCYSSCQAVGGLILYQAGETKEAERVLLEAADSLEKQRFTKAVAHACQSLAALYFAEGDQKKFLHYTKKALTLSAQINYIQNILTCYEVLTPMIQAGIEHNIELSFIQRIVLRLGSKAHKILAPLITHGDPEVRKRVCAPLAELRDDKALKAILLLSKDPNTEVKKTALHLLENNHRRTGVGQSNVEEGKSVLLKLHTLGQFRIYINGTEVPDSKWRTKKAKHLLAYLAHQDGTVSKDKIIDALWPNADGEDLDALFHTTLYRLRQALNDKLPTKIVTYQGGRYQLVPGSYQTDQTEFEELLLAASRPELSPEKMIAPLEKATALYRGDYLEDLDYPWLLPYQERLRHLYIAAKIKLGRYYLDRSDYTKAITHLHSLKGISDFSEEIHSLLMKAYAGIGDLKAVRKQFQIMTAMFREELGLSPSPEIIDLYYKLVSKAAH